MRTRPSTLPEERWGSQVILSIVPIENFSASTELFGRGPRGDTDVVAVRHYSSVHRQ